MYGQGVGIPHLRLRECKEKRELFMPETEKKKRTVRLPNFIEALIPIAVMMGLMIYGLNFRALC